MIRSVLLALAAAVLYAFSSPVSKRLLEAIGPMALAGYLYLGAGIGLSVLALLRSCRRTAGPMRCRFAKGDFKFVLLMILLDCAAPILLLFGLARTTAANASLLNNFEIVATAILAFSFFRERISFRLWMGVLFVTLACAILSFEDLESLRFSLGSPFVLLAAVCWGVENNCTRVLSFRDPMLVTIVKGFGSGTASLVLALAIGDRMGEPSSVLSAFLLGFVAYGLSILCYVRAQRDIGAARTSAYYAVAPFIGAALSFVWLAERPGPGFLLALPVMVLGTWFVTRDALGNS